MTQDSDARRNWFAQGGQDYGCFRPDYPPALAAWLAEQAPGRRCAVDVGCGSGQLTALLADHFDAVVGLDPSGEQLASAAPHDPVRYYRAPAEQLPLADGSADLVTAAQAAHWFDLPAFYAEARRIAANGAILALISYGVLRLEEALHPRFAHFYDEEIGPYWPPERKLVDSGYRDLDFPFAELSPPALNIERTWALADLLGYISTWSAVRRASEAGQGAMLSAFASDMAELWGDPAIERPVSWPLAMRVGRIAAR